MRLRTTTMAAFSAAAEASFERRMHSYLARTFGVTVAAIGDDEASALIRRGRERARTHEVTSERGVCRWVHLMFVFGRDFDREERWAAAVLERDDFSSPRARIDCLFANGMLHAAARSRVVPTPWAP